MKTRPFLSTQGGGVEIEEVHEDLLDSVIDAFVYLFGSLPDVAISGAVVCRETGRLQRVLNMVVQLVPGKSYVSCQGGSEERTYYPDGGTWGKVRLEISEEAYRKQGEEELKRGGLL